MAAVVGGVEDDRVIRQVEALQGIAHLHLVMADSFRPLFFRKFLFAGIKQKI